MEDGKNNNSTNNKNTATVTQQLLVQQHHQQLYLLQQYQQQQQQQSQQAISRFPSNIDAHLRTPGLRSLHNPQAQQQQQINSSLQQAIAAQHQHPTPQQQMKVRSAQPLPLEVEMALQDAFKVCNPEIKRPFASLEDAFNRLLPYNAVSDFEAEEDDRILDSDTTGQLPSRLQQWDHNILAKISEFTTTFEKQVLAFNIMSRKRALGEFISEERLMIEQALLEGEKHALLEIRAEIESKEKAARELARQPMRASALGSHADDSSGQDTGHDHGGNHEEMIRGWRSAPREEDDPSEDFLNDDNEPENGETGLQEEWHEVGEFDLNTR